MQTLTLPQRQFKIKNTKCFQNVYMSLDDISVISFKEKLFFQRPQPLCGHQGGHLGSAMILLGATEPNKL